MTIPEFISTIENPYKREIFEKRLKGLTLLEVGKQVSPQITRERVRQICNKLVANKRTPLHEDQFMYAFVTYDISPEDFCEIFSENLTTYYYLAMCGRRGQTSMNDFTEDSMIPHKYRQKALDLKQSRILINNMEIEGELVPITRTGLIDYVLRKYCLDDI